MSLITILLLGLVQGLTEFLPVSSSGHLRLGGAFLGIEEPQLFFDLVLHLGTLTAVIVVYRKHLYSLTRNLGTTSTILWKNRKNKEQKSWAAIKNLPGLRDVFLLIIASIPTAVMGLLLSDLVESAALGPMAVGLLLIFNGAILYSSKKSSENFSLTSEQDKQGSENKPQFSTISLPTAILIGFVQGIAVLPGISRSGITITTAMHRGISGPDAARFSFLLSIPAIMGAVVLKFDPNTLTIPFSDLLAGFIVSALTGLGALWVLLKIIHKSKLHNFSWYCVTLGLVAIVSSFLI